jgi:hypothetical protein
MQMSRLLVSLIGAIALAAVAVWWLRAAEVIRVRAVEAVPLFDPESLAGGIGEELPVLACVDRKSDINLHAAYQGKVVAVGEWKARVELLRSRAYPWERGATTSCQGFFEGNSTHA